MTWPNKIFVATKSLGVYYTSDFTDPGVQPTWGTINTGLPALDCRWFYLDPFSGGERQYVMLEATRALYRRAGGGNWVSILTSAQIAALVGQAAYATSFCVDEAVDGRVWVLVKANAFWQPIWALRSDDYGASWNSVVVQAGSKPYAAYGIRSDAANVYARCNTGSGSPARLYYSTDTGVSWNNISLDFNASHPLDLNHLLPDRCYTNTDSMGNIDLNEVTNAGIRTMLQDGLGMARHDAMWFHPTDSSYQRLFRGAKLYITSDAWSTVNVPNVIAPVPYSFDPVGGSNISEILVGLTLGTHVIGVLEGEADVTAAGIAGANAGTPPYIDSIPNTCGGLAQKGIQSLLVAVTATASTYDVEFAVPSQDDGTAHIFGLPLQDIVLNNSTIHTSEIVLET